MFEEVVGQPPQVAIANEWVASQVSEMMQISRLNDVIATQRAVTQGLETSEHVTWAVKERLPRERD